ncbi:NAD(P)/FAD-dependent oxidoreductase [Sphingomonas sp. AX6]|uniref:NAD(P)/FAD-dependent oxidoreductase n=1 Tax=Sphingomonas sp. AX6 TaxID=2653171 RepID=UPI0012F223A5|nr:FAD-dependent monooxygenase [Sphingomonas sp. AX6]VXC99228.1 FAD dependent oxidoreductase [Sphingomonas sp. AX6]
MPLIVGGGPAGAAAAIGLASAGLSPTILERSNGEQDALCGGFLSWNTVRQLADLGIDTALLGGHPVDRLALFAGKRTARFALPAPGVGLSRRTLDAAMLDAARQAGAEIRYGVTVRRVEPGTLYLADDSILRANRIVLATGKHDLRGMARPVVCDDPAMGLRWRFRASPALAERIAGAIELHLFDHGYAGLVMQEDGHANLCLAIRHSAFVAAGQRPEAVLAGLIDREPALRQRLDEEHPGPAQAIANVPYGWRATARDAHGLYRVGDQAGVIPSLAGEGVGIALATGTTAARAILEGEAPSAFQHDLARRLRRPIATASLLWHAAERPMLATAALPIIAHLPGVVERAMRMTRVSITQTSTNSPVLL